MSAATQLLAARRMVTGKHATIVLASRRRGVAHVVVGPLTPSGRWSSARARTVCTTRTRRLAVLPPLDGLGDDVSVCKRCSARLSSPVGTGPSIPLTTRDQRLAAWRGTTLRELAVGVALCATVEDTHSIGTVLLLLFGAAPTVRPKTPSVEQAVFDFDAALVRKRDHLRVAEMPEWQRAEIVAQREDDTRRDQLAAAGRRKAARLDRLRERNRAGGYLTAEERADIGATG